MKSVLKFITCGSVDDGKSTLLGRLLFETKNIFDDQMSLLTSDKKKNDNKIDFSLLLDGLSSEREQGITIDVAYRFFNTAKRKFIIADSPGHFQYTRNMVTAASSSELAIILIDARKGISQQTKRHSLLCMLLGIKGFILAINKMDLIKFSEKKYNSILKNYSIFSQEIGIKKFIPIPISALNGDNLISKSTKMPWYKGETLLHNLENFPNNNINPKDKSEFIMPVQLVNKNSNNGRTYSGKIIEGTLKVNDIIRILPSNTKNKITKILTDNSKNKFYKNESITIQLKYEHDCTRGDVLCKEKSNVNFSDQFNITLIWMDSYNLISGKQYILKIGTKTVLCRIQEIKNKVDIETFKKLSTKTLTMNEIGECVLFTNEVISFTKYIENKELGGFILIDRDNHRTVGAGLINFSLNRSKNLFLHKTSVDSTQRALIKNQQPLVIWLTGLSGSGKSTIANLIEKKLILRKFHSYLLDGDNIRLGLNKDLGFTEPDRAENIRRISETAKLFNDAGLIVITAFISPFKNERQMAKDIIGREKFIEVFVDTPLSLAEKRDPKGLYKKARKGLLKNFTGIDSPYELPISPDIHVKTDKTSAEDASTIIFEYILKKMNYDN